MKEYYEIYNGIINFYVSFRLHANKKSEFIEMIKRMSLTEIDYENKMIEYREDIKDYFNERQKKITEEIMKFIDSHKVNRCIQEGNDCVKLNEILTIPVLHNFSYKDDEYIVDIKNNFFTIHDKVIESGQYLLEEFRNLMRNNVRISGIKWAKIKTYLLDGLVWTDKSNEALCTPVTVYLHDNDIVIAKVAIPLQQNAYEQIKDFKLATVFKKVEISEFFGENKELCTNPQDIYENIVLPYFKIFEEMLCLKESSYIVNYIIPRTNKACIEIKKASDEYKKMIYCIACAPYRRQLVDKDEIERFWVENKKEYAEMAHFFPGNHVCVSVASEKARMEFIKDSEVGDEDIIDTNLSRSLEMSIDIIMQLILLYRDCNRSYCSVANVSYEKYLLKENQYINDVQYLYECMDKAMGSVCQLFEFAKEHMQFYLRMDEFSLKQSLHEKYLRDKEDIDRNSYEKRFSQIGLLFTIIFGLPAIRDSMYIIRECCPFAIIPDIPYVTMNEIATVLWILGILAYNKIKTSVEKKD